MGRGPSYPFVDLERALDVTRKIYAYSRRAPAQEASIVREALNYSLKSSAGIKIIAALKSYGLIEESAGPHGKVLRISDRAYRLLVDDPAAQEWREAVQAAALAPKWYQYCWNKWGIETPQSMRSSLIIEHGFIPTTVEGFLEDYKRTMEFSGLTGTERPETTRGVNTLETNTASSHENPKASEDVLPIVSSSQASTTGSVRTEVFSLPEGTISLQWPSQMSRESLEDVELWLTLIKRKLNRAAKDEEE